MLGLSALMSGYAQQGEGVRKGRIVREPLVHDPVMAKEGDTYYLYSTGHNVSSFSSKDLSEWTIRHGVFSAPPQWAVDSIKGYEGHTWAPDIIYYKGNYHLFYSCSAFGKSHCRTGTHPGLPRPWRSPCRRQGAWETSAATIKVRWRSCHAPTPQAGNTNGRTAYPAFARSKIVLSSPISMKPATFSPSTQRGRSSVITRHISGHR